MVRTLTYRIALAAALALAAPASQAACNERCLNSLLDRYLAQVVKHDPAPLPFAAQAITVENAKPMKPGEGAWKTVLGWPVPGHRFVDPSQGQIVYYGATALADNKIGSLFVRLKADTQGRISESELFTRGAYTGEGAESRGLLEPDILYTTVVPTARRSTRAQLIKIVDLYIEGISQHNGALFPASERCDRYQAGRKWTNNYNVPVERGGGTCQSSMNNLKGQAVVNRRFPVVDVELGIVVTLFLIPHAERDPKNTTNVAEVFKIVDGKVRSVEEFSFVGGFPPDSGFADTNDATAGLVAPGAMFNKVASGFDFAEGPAVDAAGDVYFSDIPASRIHKWSHADGRIALHRDNTRRANGLMFDAAGRLAICEMDGRRITRDDLKGNVEVLADNYQGKKLHMPNDLWIDAKGGIYFSDFAGRQGEVADDGNVVEGLQVYYLPPSGGTLRRVTEDLAGPNGLVGSADGKTLYVTDPTARKTWAYRIGANGSLSGKRLFADDFADGMKVDERDNVYFTGDAITVYSSAGEQLAAIATPDRSTNLVFAGADRRTLFVTTRDSVYTLRMSVAGAPLR